MTGMPSVPLERPGMELQAGLVPGYHLSQSAVSEPKANAMPQIAAAFEPDQLVHLLGLVVGARYAGEGDAGGSLEPLLGFRAFVDHDKRYALAAVGFGTYSSAAQNGASYTALRGGLELGADVRLTPPSRYAELHTNLGATFTALDADGHYCLDAEGRYGVDCPEGEAAPSPVSASLNGIFPSAHAGLSLDFGRHLRSPFHGVRLALDLAGGAMPRLCGGTQEAARLFGSGVLSLTVGLGADSGSGSPAASAR